MSGSASGSRIGKPRIDKPHIISPGHPSTLLSSHLNFRANLAADSEVGSLVVKLRDPNGSETVCKEACFEKFVNQDDLEILGKIDISDLVPRDNSPARQYSLCICAGEQDSDNSIDLAIEPRSRWQIARGGFLSPNTGVLGSELIVLSGWAAKRDDTLESVKIKLGNKVFDDVRVGVSSPHLAMSLPDLKEARNCIFSKIISRADLPKSGKSPLSLSAVCTFASGEKLELVSYNLSLYQPRNSIFGEIEKVSLNPLGAVVVEGWVFYPGCQPPQIQLESALKTLDEDQLVTWQRRQDIEWLNLSHAESRNYGFRIVLPPQSLGHSPGFVRLKAVSEEESVYIGKSTFWIKIGTLLHSRSPRSGLTHACKQTIASLGALYRPATESKPAKALTKRSIAFCSHNLSAVEGAPKVLGSVISSLLQGGFEAKNILILAASGGDLQERFRSKGVRVEIIPELKLEADNWESFAKGFSRASKILAEEDISLVFANTLDCFWGVRASYYAGIPNAWCLHESTRPEALLLHTDIRLRQQCLETFAYSKRLLFVSEASREIYQKYFQLEDSAAVSYTHLTLPTICSV